MCGKGLLHPQGVYTSRCIHPGCRPQMCTPRDVLHLNHISATSFFTRCTHPRCNIPDVHTPGCTRLRWLLLFYTFGKPVFGHDSKSQNRHCICLKNRINRMIQSPRRLISKGHKWPHTSLSEVIRPVSRSQIGFKSGRRGRWVST